MWMCGRGRVNCRLAHMEDMRSADANPEGVFNQPKNESTSGSGTIAAVSVTSLRTALLSTDQDQRATTRVNQ